MATQPELGLLSERRAGFDSGNPDHPSPDGQNLRRIGAALIHVRTVTIEQAPTSQEHKTMSEETKAANDDMDQLIEDVQALMAATADVAGEKVMEARKRVAAALESSKGMCGRVREKAVEKARSANEALHEHPYKAVAISAGVGLLSGLLLARRCTCKCE
jgi:ElaB/YqjD/DUF883 family membrane-anchored ribosome-binding protein